MCFRDLFLVRLLESALLSNPTVWTTVRQTSSTIDRLFQLRKNSSQDKDCRIAGPQVKTKPYVYMYWQTTVISSSQQNSKAVENPVFRHLSWNDYLGSGTVGFWVLLVYTNQGVLYLDQIKRFPNCVHEPQGLLFDFGFYTLGFLIPHFQRKGSVVRDGGGHPKLTDLLLQNTRIPHFFVALTHLLVWKKETSQNLLLKVRTFWQKQTHRHLSALQSPRPSSFNKM